MSKLKNPRLRMYKTIVRSPKIGIVIPVYNYVGNTNLAQAIYTIEQCCDMPYQLSLGIGPHCVAKNRVKGESRLDPSIRYVLQMDDDVLVPPHFASEMVQVLQSQDNIGAVSAVMVGPTGAAQNDLSYDAIGPGVVKECLPPGTCFMYDRKDVPIVWDTRYQGSQWEDTDAMMQIRATGKKTVATGNVQIMHKNNWSENKWWNENKALFTEKWPGALS